MLSVEQATLQAGLVGVGAAAVICAYLALAVTAVANRARRPPEGAATLDLGAEPPAVAAFLTEGYEVGEHAVPATLVDLAARRLVDIDDVGDGRVLVRLRPARRQPHLAPFERRVLDHVRRIAVDGVVPAVAMTTGPSDVSERWWKEFRREVVAEATERGLCRPRWERGTLVALGAGVVVGVGAAFAVNQLDTNETVDTTAEALSWVVGIAAAALGVVLAKLHRDDPQRETDTGMEAAGRWSGVRRWLAEVGDFRTLPASAVRLWDRYMAYACAFELAPVAATQLPLGAEDDRHAWSSEGGSWRPVRVRYPTRRAGWGNTPRQVLLVAAGVAVVLVLIGRVFQVLADVATSDVVGGRISLLAALPLLVPVIALAVLGRTVVRAVADLAGGTVTVEGVVLRRRRRSKGQGSDGNTEHRYFVAVDDGTAERIEAWSVSADIYARVAQGDRVRVTVHPRLGNVTDLQRLAGSPASSRPDRPSAATDAAATHRVPRTDILAGAVTRLERRLPPPPATGPDPNEQLRGMLTRLRDASGRS